MSLVQEFRARVRQAMVSVLAIARQCTTTLVSEGASDTADEVAALREELDLVRSRLARVSPRRRPYYTPTERMRILELRAVRGWNQEEVAERFLFTTMTLATWTSRCAEPDEFLKIREPVNKLGDFVRYATRRLKQFCPRLGKTKIAEILCRAGLEVSATSVGRVLKEPEPVEPEPVEAKRTRRSGKARKPDDVWHIDLTAVPTRNCGFWLPWLPGTVDLGWPFAWWVAVVVDSASRRCHGFAVFRKRPSSAEVRLFMERAIGRVGVTPKILISDREGMFDCGEFARWTQRRGIDHRLGAAGRKGSIAVIERFFLTLKNECTRRRWVPVRDGPFRQELATYVDWFNRHRPHSSLEGRTPDEVYFGREPEVVVGRVLTIEAFHGRRDLPVVRILAAA